MELNLTRPICFFDLETTGTNVAKDRIVEIAILKVFPNGNKESKTWLVNPEMPIPKEVVAIHGISDEKVANEPTFKELSSQVHDMIKGCDLGGYNSNRFDIPLLVEELLRAGVDFEMKNVVAVDVQTIFHKKEQISLKIPVILKEILLFQDFYENHKKERVFRKKKKIGAFFVYIYSFL